MRLTNITSIYCFSEGKSLITVIINNVPYSYPTAGDEPGWGGDASDAFVAVTEVLNNLFGPNDILTTNFSIANNQATPADVTGLVINGASARSVRITYDIYRISSTSTSGHAETGLIELLYDNNAGTPWSIGQGNILGEAGVTFSILNTGQVQYTSTDIGSSSYSGTMTFRSISIQVS